MLYFYINSYDIVAYILHWVKMHNLFILYITIKGKNYFCNEETAIAKAWIGEKGCLKSKIKLSFPVFPNWK